ncbi:MAG: helix-turn-helix domain-containing protein [Bacteroidota bacterium]
MNREPIVQILKRYLRQNNISHADLALRIQKHRTFVTKKLNGESMETRLLEQIMEAVGIWYEDLLKESSGLNSRLENEMAELRKEINMIKEALPSYQTKNKAQ